MQFSFPISKTTELVLDTSKFHSSRNRNIRHASDGNRQLHDFDCPHRLVFLRPRNAEASGQRQSNHTQPSTVAITQLDPDRPPVVMLPTGSASEQELAPNSVRERRAADVLINNEEERYRPANLMEEIQQTGKFNPDTLNDEDAHALTSALRTFCGETKKVEDENGEIKEEYQPFEDFGDLDTSIRTAFASGRPEWLEAAETCLRLGLIDPNDAKEGQESLLEEVIRQPDVNFHANVERQITGAAPSEDHGNQEMHEPPEKRIGMLLKYGADPHACSALEDTKNLWRIAGENATTSKIEVLIGFGLDRLEKNELSPQARGALLKGMGQCIAYQAKGHLSKELFQRLLPILAELDRALQGCPEAKPAFEALARAGAEHLKAIAGSDDADGAAAWLKLCSRTCAEMASPIPSAMQPLSTMLKEAQAHYFEVSLSEYVQAGGASDNAEAIRTCLRTDSLSLSLYSKSSVPLPECIGELQQLTKFTAKNQSGGGISEWIGNLKHLKCLELKICNLGEVPEGIRGMNHLEELELSSDEITVLPEWLGELSKLNRLVVSNNQISVLPDCIGQLKMLRSLRLGFNPLATLPDSLGELSQLKVLGLSQQAVAYHTHGTSTDGEKNTNIRLSELPACIQKLTQLNRLELENQQLTELPEWIGKLERLEVLGLSGNKLSFLPESIAALSALERLTLSDNQLSALTESVGKLGQLRRLDLAGNRFTTLPISFERLSRMQNLSLRANQFTSMPECMAKLAALRVLDFSKNDLASVPAWLGTLTKLETLNLFGNQVTELPKEVGELNKLKKLTVSGNPLNGLPEEIAHLPSTCEVFVSRTSLSDESLASFASGPMIEFAKYEHLGMGN